jgi:phospholipase C
LLNYRRFFLWFLVLGAAVTAGCRGTSAVPSVPQTGPQLGTPDSSKKSPITHVVIVIQENRTFNDFFATFPGADGTKTGIIKADAACGIDETKTIGLTEMGLIDPRDLDHSYQGYFAGRDGGKMDGFDTITFGDGKPECTYPYQYVNPSQIKPYWDMANQYTLAEHMFTTQGSSSFTGHQDLIRGGTIVAPNEAMVNFPTCAGGGCRWGCDAPTNTRTSLISEDGVYKGGQGPFPCTTHFTSPYPTLRDLLDAKNVSWKYYVPAPCCNTNGKLFTAYDVVYAVRYGPEWKTKVTWPQTNIFGDISKDELPAVSWLIPDEPDSDHPGESTDDGPEWVASVVNAIGESSSWSSTAIIVVWDDWGGLYDNLNPEQVGYGGLGFRVPALIVSPYARPHYISKTHYQFGSILKYIEHNWDLGSLGTSDQSSKSIIDCFDYRQAPIKFKHIASSLSKSYFIHRRPSYLPIDTDM